MSRTFGEFFDAVVAAVGVADIGCAGVHLQEWAQKFPRWENVRRAKLTKVLFTTFANDQADDFTELLMHTCTDDAYVHRTHDGNKFMRLIARIGRDFGVPDQACQVDAPLSIAQAITLSSVHEDFRSDGG